MFESGPGADALARVSPAISRLNVPVRNLPLLDKPISNVPLAAPVGPMLAPREKGTVPVPRTVRIWDPATGARLLNIPVRDCAEAVAYAGELLFIGTEVGVLTIRLAAELLQGPVQ